MAKPDRAVIVEPATTRSLNEWTPSLLKAARSLADGGNLELAADFCESAMGDDRVAAALSTRTKGLIALPLTFEAVRGTKRLVKALEAGEDWWAAFPATALAQLLAWGILLGVGLARIVWTDRGETINRIVPTLQVWHPRHLRYDWQRRVWTVKVEGGKVVDVVPGEGEWVLYMPYGDSRPWAFGTWRAISLWHLLKSYAITDWAFYSEKNGGGHLVAESDKDAKLTKEARKELAADLFEAKANSAMVLPQGMTLRKVESTANTWETFREQKNAADMGMSVAILGQNLSTEASGPVSTGATLHGRVLQVFIDADAETLSTCIHDQALVWWAEFNFGSRDNAPWPVWSTKPPEDQKQRADVGKTQSETAKNLAGIGVATVNEVREAAGLDPLTEGGDELVKVSAPVAAAAANTPQSDGKAKRMSNIETRIALLEGRTRSIARALIRERGRMRAEARRLEKEIAKRSEERAGEMAALRVSLDRSIQNAFDRCAENGDAIRRVELIATECRAEMFRACDSLRTEVSTTNDVLERVRDLTNTSVDRIDALVREHAERVAILEEESVRLRSGRTIPTRSGFVQGQRYADAVADNARDRASAVLDEDVVAVLEAIDSGESYDDIRARLVKTYKGMSPANLAKLTEAAITMAELGGRHAINEDL